MFIARAGADCLDGGGEGLGLGSGKQALQRQRFALQRFALAGGFTPGIGGGFVIREERQRHHPGVIHQTIDGPESILGLCCEIDHRSTIRDVGDNAQRFDVVASALYVTPERAKQVDFLSYLKTGSSLMVLSAGDFKPQRPEDLCGKRVGSIKGASWVPKLNQVSADYCVASGKPAIQSREFPPSPEAAQALLAQAVDVQMEDAAVAKITVEKLHGKTVISSNELIYPVVVGLAVRKDNPELLKELTGALSQIKQDGSYGKLLARYNLAEPSAADVSAALGN